MRFAAFPCAFAPHPLNLLLPHGKKGACGASWCPKREQECRGFPKNMPLEGCMWARRPRTQGVRTPAYVGETRALQTCPWKAACGRDARAPRGCGDVAYGRSQR